MIKAEDKQHILYLGICVAFLTILVGGLSQSGPGKPVEPPKPQAQAAPAHTPTDTVYSVIHQKTVAEMKVGEEGMVFLAWRVSKQGHVWLDPEGRIREVGQYSEVSSAVGRIRKESDGFHITIGQINEDQLSGDDSDYVRDGRIRVVGVTVQ